MRFAMVWVMAWSLLRDRAALAMSFLLPGVVFVIFALIFAGATGGELTTRLVIVDERKDKAAERLVQRLLEEKRVARVGDSSATAQDAEAMVLRGLADVGVVLRRRSGAADALDGVFEAAQGATANAPPILLIADPAREIAVSVMLGHVQRAFLAAVPEAPIRSVAGVIDKRFVAFSPEQKARLSKGLDALRDTAAKTETTGATKAEDGASSLPLDKLTERRDVVALAGISTAVTYYAGAVAMLFLLSAALTGAMSYLDERESGLTDRLATGPGGVRVLLDGKMLFLVLQGTLQVLVIYLVAWAAFGVDLPGHAVPWFATTVAAAIAAGGLALAFVTLCQSRQQAQTLGNMLILVVSAIGGSMVPRYLMPPEVQGLGWATPNTWAIEAYSAIFYRREGLEQIWLPITVLVGSGLAGLIVAHMAARARV